MEVVYFSSATENTRRFVDKLQVHSTRIPLRRDEPTPLVTSPFVLVVPTYGGGEPAMAVPRQVIRFLNEETNRNNLVGVIAAGNTNFGSHYCLAGDIIAQKCQVPVLYRFEILGTPEDVEHVRNVLETL